MEECRSPEPPSAELQEGYKNGSLKPGTEIEIKSNNTNETIMVIAVDGLFVVRK